MKSTPAATPKPPRKIRSDRRGEPKLVTVRFTVEEYAAIAEAVARENAEMVGDGAEGSTTVSSWLRDHALDPLGLLPRDSAE